jgi:mRNA interferase MazF
MAGAPRRGDVWIARLDKRRPVVVLTRNPMGEHLNQVIVVPVTSTVRGISTEVPLGPDDGIRKTSVANLDSVQLVKKVDLLQRVGGVRPAKMSQICRALRIAVDCR